MSDAQEGWSPPEISCPPDCPVATADLVFAVQDWATNAALIADVARLGYIKPADRVLDVTYGRGAWWRQFRPQLLTCHDLHRLDGVDFCALPEPDSSFDVVAFDPPYIFRSGSRRTTPEMAIFQDRYGIDNGPKSMVELWTLITGGINEAARVVRPGGIVLAKCMPIQTGRKFRHIPAMVMAYAEGLGLDTVDEFVHRRNAGPTANHSLPHQRARRNASVLLVLRRRIRPRRETYTYRTCGTYWNERTQAEQAWMFS